MSDEVKGAGQLFADIASMTNEDRTRFLSGAHAELGALVTGLLAERQGAGCAAGVAILEHSSSDAGFNNSLGRNLGLT